MDVIALDGRAFLKFLTAGTYFVRKYRHVLNDLNVFPVPDGDTGTNMDMTLRSALFEAAKVRDRGLPEVAAQAAQGALMGARGNSGVILSQMLRGFAHHVRHRKDVDAFVLATALKEASGAARQALVRPVEGTIVSVADAAADAAYHLALHERDLYRFLRGVLRAANEALDRTPEQLPALKEAGVVDSGGAGFVYFLEGALSFLPEVKVRQTAFPRRPARARVFTAAQVVGENKFCTEFVLEDATIGAAELRRLLEPRGESLLVIGAEPTLKVHVHTDDPHEVQELAAKHGRLTRLKVDDMERQHNVLVVDRPQRPYSIVAVVPGPGFERIVRELGAEVVIVVAQNPSVRELLLAVNKALGDVVYLFVNDKNAVLAAGEAGKLSSKRVEVVPTRDVVEGIAGLFAVAPAAAAQSQPELASILGAARRIRSGQLYHAGKDAAVGGVSVARGQAAGSYDGRLVAGQTLADAARALCAAMGAHEHGLITLYYGGTQKEKDAQRLAADLQAAFPGVDVEYYYGGMKNGEYWVSLDE